MWVNEKLCVNLECLKQWWRWQLLNIWRLQTHWSWESEAPLCARQEEASQKCGRHGRALFEALPCVQYEEFLFGLLEHTDFRQSSSVFYLGSCFRGSQLSAAGVIAGMTEGRQRGPCSKEAFVTVPKQKGIPRWIWATLSHPYLFLS